MREYTIARKKIKDILGSGQVQTDTYMTVRLNSIAVGRIWVHSLWKRKDWSYNVKNDSHVIINIMNKDKIMEREVSMIRTTLRKRRAE